MSEADIRSLAALVRVAEVYRDALLRISANPKTLTELSLDEGLDAGGFVISCWKSRVAQLASEIDPYREDPV